MLIWESSPDQELVSVRVQSVKIAYEDRERTDCATDSAGPSRHGLRRHSGYDGHLPAAAYSLDPGCLLGGDRVDVGKATPELVNDRESSGHKAGVV